MGIGAPIATTLLGGASALDGASGSGPVSILDKLRGTLQNGAQNLLGSLTELFKGNLKGAASQFIAGCFGAPPPGQTDQANKDFGASSGLLLADPLKGTFSPMQSEGTDDEYEDDKAEINKKEAEDKMFRTLELNKIYSNSIAG